MRRFSLSAGVVALLLLVFGLSSWAWRAKQGTPLRVITWDVYGYYLYLPALFIYGDTKSYDFVEAHHATYRFSGSVYQLNRLDAQTQAPIYTMGQAMLYASFFALAHGWALWDETHPPDGMSLPYQVAIIGACLFYALLGWLALRRFLRRYFDDGVVATSLLLLGLGTNYYHYVSFESGMPHTYLFALFALLLNLIASWAEKPDVAKSAGIGFLLGLACLSRPSEAVFALLWLMYPSRGPKAWFSWWWRHRTCVAWVLAAGLLTILPQLLYWKLNLGLWIYNGYEGHWFDFLSPHLWEGLFSYRKGWLLYTPLMAFALLGFIPLYRSRQDWFWPVLTYVLINLYIVFSWHMWWYASSFGARGVIQSYAVLALPFTAFVQVVLARRMVAWWPWPVLLLLVALAGFNQFQDWQYRQKILPQDETTRTYYWKVFARTRPAPMEWRKYLDVDEALAPDRIRAEQSLAEWTAGAEKGSEELYRQAGETAERVAGRNAYSYSLKVEVGQQNLHRLQGQWVRVKARVLTRGNQSGTWDTAYLVFDVEREPEEHVKWIGLRFQRFVDAGAWTEVQYECRLPQLKEGDLLRTMVWNKGPDSVYVQSLQLQLLQLK